MVIYNNNYYIPIGCSCINQFEIRRALDGSQKQYSSKSSFFDWVISTPDSTIQLLNLLFEGREMSILSNKNDYHIVNGKLAHKYFEGLIFYHEDALKILSDSVVFDNFLNKITHQLSTFLQECIPGGKRIFLWSNCQPNLQHEMRNFPSEIRENFSLSHDRYLEILGCVDKIFGDSLCNFIVRPSDTDEILLEQYNVHPLEISATSNYDGLDNLFPIPILSKIFIT